MKDTTLYAVRIPRETLERLRKTLSYDEVRSLNAEVKALINSKLDKKYTAENETEETI